MLHQQHAKRADLATASRAQSPPYEAGVLLDRSRCPLLKLPAEIRNQIYDLVLVSRWFGTYAHVDVPTQLTRKRDWKQPALTYISRQVRRETTPISFGDNVFRLELRLKHAFECAHFERWLRLIGGYRHAPIHPGPPPPSMLHLARYTGIVSTNGFDSAPASSASASRT